MSSAKTERQLNLLFLLLNTAQPIEREEIRRRISGYFGKTNEAFERMFERDKDDLRDLNIPIETVTIDTFHEDLQGYVIRKDTWLMPKIVLTATERSLLNLAAAAWQEAQLAGAMNQAVSQLAAKEQITSSFQLDVATQSSAIATILEAKSKNKCIEFTYSSANSNTQESRLVAPWRIFLSSGNSYLIGFDQQKGEQRTFKLARIVGTIKITDEEILEAAPADLSSSEIVANWQGSDENITHVKLDVIPSKAGSLRLQAAQIQIGTDFDRLIIETQNLQLLAKDVARNCSDVKIVEPILLREMVDQIVEQAI
jgi:proteasome accessory factor B